MNKKQKILIIEDEPLVLKTLNNQLLQKYDVLAASDGETGLNIMKEEIPDMVLLDLVLPGMHGFEVLKKAKEDALTRNIPIVILSNMDTEEDVRKGKELGATEYLIKIEAGFDVIQETIERILQQKN